MKKCLSCGGPLTKRAHESEKRFKKKQFCSASCSRVYMKKHKMGWWSPENRGVGSLDTAEETWEA